MRERIQGRPLTPEEKYCVVSIKQYFDRNKDLFATDASSVQLTADAFGIGLATVMRIMASYNKNPKNLYVPPQAKGRPAYAVSVFENQNVRAFYKAGEFRRSSCYARFNPRIFAERSTKRRVSRHYSCKNVR